MSWDTVAEAIKAVISTVDGVGKTYTLPQRADRPEDFKDIYMVKVDGKMLVNAWIIRREAFLDTTATLPGPPVGTWFREHRFVIEGYYGAMEDNFGIFQDLLDRIATALTKEPRLGSRVWSCSLPSVRRIDQEMFGRVLCHIAEIELTVTEKLTSS